MPEVVSPQEVGGVGDGGRWCHRYVDQQICTAGLGQDARSRTAQPLMKQYLAENEKQKNCRWYNAWCILSASSTTTRQDIGVSQAYNPTSPVTKELVVAPKAERARGGVVVRW